MTNTDKITKRIFDILFSFLGLILISWFIILTAIIASLLSGKNGFFYQKRVGQYGKLFTIFKIRSLEPSCSNLFKKYGYFLREKKIDELPQLLNVLLGQMSFVGPRPDLPGFADELQSDDRKILDLKPGITGPASLYFKNEAEILRKQQNEEHFNRNVIWPQKVLINKKYLADYSLINDIKYIIQTLF